MNGGIFQGYTFLPVPVQRSPGPAYHSPLQQYMPYPMNTVQGVGSIVKASPRVAMPADVMVYMKMVDSSGNGPGTTQGQMMFQSLTITSSNNNASA